MFYFYWDIAITYIIQRTLVKSIHNSILSEGFFFLCLKKVAKRHSTINPYMLDVNKPDYVMSKQVKNLYFCFTILQFQVEKRNELMYIPTPITTTIDSERSGLPYSTLYALIILTCISNARP